MDGLKISRKETLKRQDDHVLYPLQYNADYNILHKETKTREHQRVLKLYWVVVVLMRLLRGHDGVARHML